MKRATRRGLAWATAVVALLAVFSMYTRPDLVVNLASQMWSCF